MHRGLIAIDFDGTLLRSDRSISARTHEALAAATAEGWVVVGATGRPRQLAEAVAELVEPMRYLVCLNGSQLVDLESGTVVHDELLDAEHAADAATAIRELIADVGLAVDLADGQMWERGFEHHVTLRPLGDPVDDVVEALLTDQVADVRKLLAFVADPSDDDVVAMIHMIDAEIGTRFGVAHAGLPFVEVGPLGVSKASSLGILAARLELDVGRCVALGDEVNDHEMLRWAGTGVAMANADSTTRDVADLVTSSNDDDGVALYVESLLGSR